MFICGSWLFSKTVGAMTSRLPVSSHRVFVLQAQVFGMAISQRPFEPQEDQSKLQVATIAEKNPAG
jgi:hypothetical protein